MNPHPHIDGYFIADWLWMCDNEQYARVVERCAAERDLAVAALRRIRTGELGAGDMYMIASDALYLTDEEDTSDYPADLAYSEAREYLIELNTKTDEDN